MRKIQLTVSLVLLALGLAIVAYDAAIIRQFGFDVNDMFFVTLNGEAADWPTGERPSYSLVPAYVYGFGFWLAAALVMVPWPEPGKAYRGRVIRGAE